MTIAKIIPNIQAINVRNYSVFSGLIFYIYKCKNKNRLLYDFIFPITNIKNLILGIITINDIKKMILRTIKYSFISYVVKF